MAKDLEACAAAPPWQLDLLLATAFLLLKKDELALIELEALDRTRLPSPEATLAACVLEAFAYRLNGCPRLAAQELEAGLGPEQAALFGPELQVEEAARYAVHALSAANRAGLLAAAAQAGGGRPVAEDVQVAAIEGARRAVEDAIRAELVPWLLGVEGVR